jgi:hypothetical protein
MKHTSELGTIEFRLPSVPESLELYARMGVTPQSLTDQEASIQNPFMLMSKLIAHMGFLVTKVECEIDGSKITKYDELTQHMSAMADLCAVAGSILQAMNGGSEAKKK